MSQCPLERATDYHRSVVRSFIKEMGGELPPTNSDIVVAGELLLSPEIRSKLGAGRIAKVEAAVSFLT